VRLRITHLLGRFLLLVLLYGLVGVVIPTPISAAEYDCCKCGLEQGANGCTIPNGNCTADCPTSTPKPLDPPTNTPPAGATATPTGGGGGGGGNPTTTPPGNCNTVCDIDCSAGATASYWQERQWPSNSGQCCIVCNASDWCQYSGWTCDGGGQCWQWATRECINGGIHENNGYGNCTQGSPGTPITNDPFPDCPSGGNWSKLCREGPGACPAPPVQPTFTPTNTPTPTPTMPPVSGLTASCTAFGGPINLNWSYSSPAEYRVIRSNTVAAPEPRQLTRRPSLPPDKACLTASGSRSATWSRARAGPLGLRRPCSQFCNVPTLMPIMRANLLCD